MTVSGQRQHLIGGFAQLCLLMESQLFMLGPFSLIGPASSNQWSQAEILSTFQHVLFMFLCKCIHVCVCVCTCTHVYVCTSMHKYSVYMFVCMHLYVCVREMSSSISFPLWCLRQVSFWNRRSLFSQTSMPASPPRPPALGLHVCHHIHHPHFHMDAELRFSCQRGQYFAGGAASPALNRLSGCFPQTVRFLKCLLIFKLKNYTA